MTATRRDRAALHYTALTSLNVVGIFAGSILGAALADLFGVSATFVVSAALCLAPLPLLRRWDRHAAQSAGLEDARATP
jgi:predicted MFS family arabinose efflux permease